MPLLLGFFLFTSLVGVTHQAQSSAQGKAQEYNGYFTEGFEWKYFVACNGSEQWWLKENQILAQLRETLINKKLNFKYEEIKENPKVYISITGKLSKRGKWGHLAKYPHELTIVEIHKLSLSKEDICKS